MWLHPIIDFSLPPQHVYEHISAFELLEGQVPAKIDQQVVLIVPWQYEEAGVNIPGADNFPLPKATRFWRGTTKGTTQSGGESHAYMLHHFLHQHIIIPIPDFLMILIAALLGKSLGSSHLYKSASRKQILLLSGGSLVVVVITWQLYITCQVLVPYFLPLLTFWSYIDYALRSSISES
jgi:hypothetical protein